MVTATHKKYVARAMKDIRATYVSGSKTSGQQSSYPWEYPPWEYPPYPDDECPYPEWDECPYPLDAAPCCTKFLLLCPNDKSCSLLDIVGGTDINS